ncbi:MAG: hypothetical protein Harvfovirus2_45 [Harvfovirus sp.]|uniref:G-protein coupled receptors family 1 profile domain-containing protein n=1 Tax=Harvfovirus sp. TaxID=2487768 RepID=A0A3G5A011_9VIRU|nr:MAG: hypothetical protein Harvfovirus2_45 [Harvfovirus sp.]
MTHNVTHGWSDDDDDGVTYKGSIWGLYIGINLLGTLLCSMIIISAARQKQILQNDIFVIGLCVGCIIMSAPCLIECIVNISSDTYDEAGDQTCNIESMFHLIAMITQFCFTSLIAIKSFFLIAYGNNISTKTMKSIIAVTLGIGILGSIIFGVFSETTVMASGTWCFYKFSSLAVIAWFTPCVIITGLSIIISYVKIFRIIKKSKERVMAYVSNSSNDQAKVAKKASIFVLCFLVSWTPMIVASIMELAGEQINEIFDIVIMTLGSFNSVFVAVIYGHKYRSQNRTKILVSIRSTPVQSINMSVPTS